MPVSPLFRVLSAATLALQAAATQESTARGVVEALAIRPGGIVCEIGAGDGALTLEVARAVRDRRVSTRLIVLSMHSDAPFLNAALDAGVHGYVPKESAIAEIAGAIRSVHAGHQYVSPVLSGALIARSRRADALARELPALESLTPTEMKVLKLVAEVKTTKEIADVLCISPRTVEHHRASIAAKLDLRGSHALTRFAVKHQSSLRDR